MALERGTLVLTGIERIPKTDIPQFAPGILLEGSNEGGWCDVVFGSAFPDFSSVSIRLHEDALIPLLVLPEEDRQLDPNAALQQHWREAIKTLANFYLTTHRHVTELRNALTV